MSRDDLLDDLAYARALAEEGRNAPLIGGAYLVLFGVLLCASYALHWAIFTGRIEALAPGHVGFVWIGFAVAAAIGMLALNSRVRSKPGGSTTANRVDARVWRGVGITISVVAVGILTQAILSGDFANANAIMAAGFGLYGLALYVTAGISGQRWLGWIAALAWAASAALWFSMAESWAYLIASAACLVVLAGPGLVLMRREPAAIV